MKKVRFKSNLFIIFSRKNCALSEECSFYYLKYLIYNLFLTIEAFHAYLENPV